MNNSSTKRVYAKRPLESRFWEKVNILDPESCWEWQSSIKPNNGYGVFGIDGRMRLAHRVAFTLSVGDIPDDTQVLHRCDNPKCVNPAHLFLGTHLDNMRDKVRKGRQSRAGRGPKGEDAATSKLTEKQVREIRDKYATDRYTHAQLAIEYDLTPTAIGAVIRFQTWKHVLKRIRRKKK